MTVTAQDIARVAHEVNRAYCQSQGDTSQLPFDQISEEQHQSLLKGVMFHANGNHTPADSHQSWMEDKAEAGWTYGTSVDHTERTHPCMVPFDQMAPEQRAKDFLFVGVVHSMRGLLEDAPKVSLTAPEPAETQDVASPRPLTSKYMPSLDGDDDRYDFSEDEMTEVLQRFERGVMGLGDVMAYLDDLEEHIKVEAADETQVALDALREQIGANLMDTFASMTQVQIGFDGLIDANLAKLVMDTPCPEDKVQKLLWFAEAEGRVRYLKADGMLKARVL